MQLILAGHLKKLVLGDVVGAWLVDPVFERPGDWAHGWEVLLALYGYSLQVYADFSGYTDMAKGMAGLLGIALPRQLQLSPTEPLLPLIFGVGGTSRCRSGGKITSTSHWGATAP